MRKQVKMVLSIICCLAIMLPAMSQVAKASPDVYIEHIPDAVFYYEGGVIECKAKESHGYKMTYNWIGGTTNDPTTFRADYFDSPQTERTLVPPAKLGVSYYMCQVFVDGEAFSSNVFKVEFKEVLKEIIIVKEPTKCIYEVNTKKLDFTGMKIEMVTETYETENYTVKMEGDTIPMNLDCALVQYGESDGLYNTAGDKGFVLYSKNSGNYVQSEIFYVTFYTHDEILKLTPKPTATPTPTPTATPAPTPVDSEITPTPVDSEITPTPADTEDITPTPEGDGKDEGKKENSKGSSSNGPLEFQWWMLSIPGGLILIVLIIMIVLLKKRSK